MHVYTNDVGMASMHVRVSKITTELATPCFLHSSMYDLTLIR